MYYMSIKMISIRPIFFSYEKVCVWKCMTVNFSVYTIPLEIYNVSPSDKNFKHVFLTSNAYNMYIVCNEETSAQSFCLIAVFAILTFFVVFR